MTWLPYTPLIVGPAELVIIAVLVVILLFGSQAPEKMRVAGEKYGKVKSSKQQAGEELNKAKDELKEVTGVDEIQEDVDEVKNEIDEVADDLAMKD